MTREHIPLDVIPIPEDEKALFVSLRLLQDKVSELERAKSDAERKIDEMRQENAALKAGRSHRKDKHGRSRVYESEDDDHRRDAGSHYQSKLPYRCSLRTSC
jgi:regulator of replication initiation timing